MPAKTYRLNKRWRTIFIVLGVIGCVLIVLIPLGIMMFVLVKKARIEVSDEQVLIWWLGTRRIKWSEFEEIRQGRLNVVRGSAVGRLLGAAFVSEPITYKLKGEKRGGARIAIHWHESSKEILQEFQTRTGLQIQGLR